MKKTLATLDRFIWRHCVDCARSAISNPRPTDRMWFCAAQFRF